MDCPEAKSGKVAVRCPPDDSLVEIFSRLPAKPLFRCKCVSRDWCGLIADRLRCRKFPQTLLGFFAGHASENYGHFIDLSGRPVPLVDPSFSFLTKSPEIEIEKMVLLGSCNGLVLFRHTPVSYSYPHPTLGYIVCNPATEEWVSVPSSGYTPVGVDDGEIEYHCHQDDDRHDTYLIFDPAISPHFQLIQFRDGYGLIEVLTFSSVTGAWRLELKGLQNHTFLGVGVCVFNGMLHLGARTHSDLPADHMIFAVGGEGRPLRTLHWPKNDRGVLVFVGQSQGHLLCVGGQRKNVYEMTGLSFWVLEDYIAEKWVLRDNVSFPQLFGRMTGCFRLDWDVFAIHPYHSLVFFADYKNCKLISYDMDNKEVHDVCSSHGFHYILYIPYFAESVALAKKH